MVRRFNRVIRVQRLCSVREFAGGILAAIFRVCICFVYAQSQMRPRLAVLPITGDDDESVAEALRSLALGDTALGAELIDQDLTLAAAAGSGLMGNLNLSLGQARSLGGSLGADFYLLGKLVNSRRASIELRDENFYFESMAGIFLVDSRSGRLLLFQLVRARGQELDEADPLLGEKLPHEWPAFPAAIKFELDKRREAIDGPPMPVPEVELTDADLTGPAENLPVFYQRLKPDYTAEAELAGITGSVELEAVFRDDGRIDDISVVRWAGFGLDESAVATLKRLQFKPAERDGKKLTIRGLVRYNFNRPRAQEPVTPSQKSEEAERLKRSLQRILTTPGRIPDKPQSF